MSMDRDFTKHNTPPMKSTKTPETSKAPGGARTGAEPAKARGVEHPVAEDAALIGDTRHALHHQPLPRNFGPNYGLGHGKAPGEQFRVDCGEGVGGEM